MAALTREAYCLDEEKLMELREDGAAGVDAGLEEGFRALRCQAAALQHAERLSSWDWAEKIRGTGTAGGGDDEGGRGRHPARRVGRGAAGAGRLVGCLARGRGGAARRLQEKELRRVAAADHHLVDPDMPAFLGYVAAHTDASLEAAGLVLSNFGSRTKLIKFWTFLYEHDNTTSTTHS
jgi:hypothetical protein